MIIINLTVLSGQSLHHELLLVTTSHESISVIPMKCHMDLIVFKISTVSLGEKNSNCDKHIYIITYIVLVFVISLHSFTPIPMASLFGFFFPLLYFDLIVCRVYMS